MLTTMLGCRMWLLKCLNSDAATDWEARTHWNISCASQPKWSRENHLWKGRGPFWCQLSFDKFLARDWGLITYFLRLVSSEARLARLFLFMLVPSQLHSQCASSRANAKVANYFKALVLFHFSQEQRHRWMFHAIWHVLGHLKTVLKSPGSSLGGRRHHLAMFSKSSQA